VLARAPCARPSRSCLHGVRARVRARPPPAARCAGARRRARAQGMLLRRTKATLIDGAPVVDLPERRVTLRRIAFSPPERAFYERVQQESARELKARARAPRALLGPRGRAM